MVLENILCYFIPNVFLAYLKIDSGFFAVSSGAPVEVGDERCFKPA